MMESAAGCVVRGVGGRRPVLRRRSGNDGGDRTPPFTGRRRLRRDPNGEGARGNGRSGIRRGGEVGPIASMGTGDGRRPGVVRCRARGRAQRRSRRRYYATSASTVIGNARIRLPVAWYTAFAMAAATPVIPISPIPRTPNGFTYGSGAPTNRTSSTWMSALTGT